MPLSSSALRENFDSNGVSAIIPALEAEQQDSMKALLRIATTSAEEKIQDFNRGRYDAFEEMIDLIRELTKA